MCAIVLDTILRVMSARVALLLIVFVTVTVIVVVPLLALAWWRVRGR